MSFTHWRQLCKYEENRHYETQILLTDGNLGRGNIVSSLSPAGSPEVSVSPVKGRRWKEWKVILNCSRNLNFPNK